MEFRLLFIVVLYIRHACSKNYVFPEDFIFGTATSAYQIEGAWNASGKGPNIFDVLYHLYPAIVPDGSNGDVACDSYHKYRDDIRLIKELRTDFYRFSISWTRIFPFGLPYMLNREGVAYYNSLLDELVANNVTPMVTLFHWDLPYYLEEMGGFFSSQIITYIVEFAGVAFAYFGEKVKYWITFNEPYQFCWLYSQLNSPSGLTDYVCGYNLLKAHAVIYHLYEDYYKPSFRGKVGITINGVWYEPNSTSVKDEEAAERLRLFTFGWFAHPIFSIDGDYPAIMKEFVQNRSLEQGFVISRLPEFTPDEIKYIRGTADFLGLNHFLTELAADNSTNDLTISFENDHQVVSWTDDARLQNGTVGTPWGFRKLLIWIKKHCDNPTIFITENGHYDYGGLQDNDRISYIQEYLKAMLDALYGHSVAIKGYAVWSLMDTFGWLNGYIYKYGLYYVNFTDPGRPRIPKASARFYRSVIGNRSVVDWIPSKSVANTSSNKKDSNKKEVIKHKSNIVKVTSNTTENKADTARKRTDAIANNRTDTSHNKTTVSTRSRGNGTVSKIDVKNKKH